MYCALVTDPKHNPYGHPVMMVCMVVALVCLVAVFVLWGATFGRAPRKVRNFIILVLAIFILYIPCAYLFVGLYDLVSDVFHVLLGD